jgi:hypothetical protein
MDLASNNLYMDLVRFTTFTTGPDSFTTGAESFTTGAGSFTKEAD